MNLVHIVERELKNKNVKLVAIGETGLDYHFDYPIELQKEYIEKGITKAEYQDILPVYNNKELSGFVSVLEIEKDNSKITKVLKYDVDGNNTKTIKEDFSKLTDYDKKILIDLIKSMSNNHNRQ